MRQLTYTIQPVRWIQPDTNAPMAYFQVCAGDDPRDYAAVDYRPRVPLTGAVFRTIGEAESFIARQA